MGGVAYGSQESNALLNVFLCVEHYAMNLHLELSTELLSSKKKKKYSTQFPKDHSDNTVPNEGRSEWSFRNANDIARS